MIWTPLADDDVDAMRARGFTYSKIARYLVRTGHPGCTKNAVVGRLWRRRRHGDNYAPRTGPFSLFAGLPKLTPRTNAPWRRVG